MSLSASPSPDLDPASHPQARPFFHLVDSPLVAVAALLLLAVALLGPRLGDSGLWDPHEVRLLESATEPVQGAQPAPIPAPGEPAAEQAKPSLFDARSLWQPKSFRPRLPLLPIAIGTRIFGVNELGGRVPMLTLALLTLLLLYGFGRWLGQGRGALLAGLVLLTSPLFFMSARHTSVTLLPMLAHTAALFGLAALAWPRAQHKVVDRVMGTVLAALGLSAGLLSMGAVVGVAAPLGAVALALALADGPALPQLLLGGLCGGALIPALRLLCESATLPAAWRLGWAGGCLLVAALAMIFTRERRVLGLAMLLTVIAIGLLPALPAERQSGYSPWFAGIVHWPSSREPQVDTLLKNLGFFLFPWSALLPLAFVSLFTRLADDQARSEPAAKDRSATRERYAALLPLTWFALTYALLTFHSALVGDMSFPAVPALALLVGLYLQRLLSDSKSSGLAAGMCVIFGAAMVGRDYFFAPEQYLSGHLSETLRWPAPLQPVAQFLVIAALIVAAPFGLGYFTGLRWRQRLLGVGLFLATLAAAVAVHGLSPALSKHVSYRGLYTRYKNLGGGSLGLFGVQQASGKIYGQNSVQLYSLPDLLQFLSNAKQPGQRIFAIVGAAELGGIDREARLRGQPYFVIDDTNAQFLLLSNRLATDEKDLNPLRRFVSTTEPHPQVPTQVTFDDKIELIGYDMPAEVGRGDDLVIRMYFRVLAPIGGGYKVFMHFDGMGTRWNGDHPPLEGKFATNFWSPGTYVTDEHHISISRISQPAGYYQVFMGFWPGGDGARLKVTAGNHESDQRVRIGVLRVK